MAFELARRRLRLRRRGRTFKLDPAKSRPIRAEDYARIRVLLLALDNKELAGDDRPFPVILHEVIEDHLGEELFRGDKLVDRELRHASVVCQALQMGLDRVPARVDGGPWRQCSTPGCAAKSYGQFCFVCQVSGATV